MALGVGLGVVGFTAFLHVVGQPIVSPEDIVWPEIAVQLIMFVGTGAVGLGVLAGLTYFRPMRVWVVRVIAAGFICVCVWLMYMAANLFTDGFSTSFPLTKMEFILIPFGVMVFSGFLWQQASKLADHW